MIWDHDDHEDAPTITDDCPARSECCAGRVHRPECRGYADPTGHCGSPTCSVCHGPGVDHSECECSDEVTP